MPRWCDLREVGRLQQNCHDKRQSMRMLFRDGIRMVNARWIAKKLTLAQLRLHTRCNAGRPRLITCLSLLPKRKGAGFTPRMGARSLTLRSAHECINLGFNHPKVVAALKEQLDKTIYVTDDFATETTARLSKKLPN